MNPRTKKILIISGSVAVVGLSIYLLTKKKDDNKTSTSNTLPPSSGSSNSTNTGNDTSIIGKKAFADKEPVYVMPTANSLSFLAIPNGVLSKGEEAGTITASAIGKDDNKLWYSVVRGSNYSCPIWKCGLGALTNNNSGWVLASEVKLV